MKKVLKILLILILIVIAGIGGLLGWLSATEYKPGPVEPADQIHSEDAGSLTLGTPLDILSWNIGYAGLGKESDFFMDGGKNVRAADKTRVNEYLEGIRTTIQSQNCDIVLLQEVDADSFRTYGINEAETLAGGNSSFALNFSCPFVPNPNSLLIHPIGKVKSGLLTVTDKSVEKAERISLPCPFSWPLRIANLKRCLLVSYLPIEGSDSQLVLVNLHLEAYDDGEGKKAQTRQLQEFIREEYEKGNYVIAGGDFNQVFPGSLEVYPNSHADLWEPGVLDDDVLPEKGEWQFAYSLDSPTCRLLNQPYHPEDTANTQYYVIDGFILSPNVELNLAENLGDEDFANSDHNPVHINVTLK